MMSLCFRAILLAVLLLLSSLSVVSAKPPNIVLILADDLGFTDTQPYGGEIPTPNIDKLAREGVMFTNYHTAATCSPSRAMLMTGVDSHLAGVPDIPMSIPQDIEREDYNGVLNDNVVTVATLLRDAGYHTYLSGKWHLGYSKEGQRPDQVPSKRGFERTFALMESGADNYEDKPYVFAYPDASWYEDGKPIVLPEDFYSSRNLIDKAIEFIESNREDNKPFFSYVSLQAVHFPVQAPREYTEKYMGRYDMGWQ
ncbi:MAG: sulfatase-like hydrolase/transferase, partial [Desulfobacterales bacterium]|nr:sulfatase-like hydrolase/transferase [Desulfobacterales bacterium]